MKKFSLALLLLSSLFLACNKESGTSELKILLTDAPLAVEEVNIDLREVRVKLEKDTTSWHTLQTNAGVFNLLALQNNVTSLIATGSFPNTENVKEIRLILGPNNTIVEGGQTYPLTIPSGEESGLKIKIGKKLRSSFETVVIDFDAALSVKKENDGYKLRPVLKLK